MKTDCCKLIPLLKHLDLFKALCDPSRMAVFSCLARCAEPQSVSEIASCCTVDISVVSRHLALLKQAGILGLEKRGRCVFYSIRYGELAASLRACADAIEACCPPSPGGKRLSPSQKKEKSHEKKHPG